MYSSCDNDNEGVIYILRTVLKNTLNYIFFQYRIKRNYTCCIEGGGSDALGSGASVGGGGVALAWSF